MRRVKTEIKSLSESDELSGIYVDKNADGYRLPTAAEWEYAAYGAYKDKNQYNRSFKYSGSDTLEEVGVVGNAPEVCASKKSKRFGALRYDRKCKRNLFQQKRARRTLRKQ